MRGVQPVVGNGEGSTWGSGAGVVTGDGGSYGRLEKRREFEMIC